MCDILGGCDGLVSKLRMCFALVREMCPLLHCVSTVVCINPGGGGVQTAQVVAWHMLPYQVFCVCYVCLVSLNIYEKWLKASFVACFQIIVYFVSIKSLELLNDW